MNYKSKKYKVVGLIIVLICTVIYSAWRWVDWEDKKGGVADNSQILGEQIEDKIDLKNETELVPAEKVPNVIKQEISKNGVSFSVKAQKNTQYLYIGGLENLNQAGEVIIEKNTFNAIWNNNGDKIYFTEANYDGNEPPSFAGNIWAVDQDGSGLKKISSLAGQKIEDLDLSESPNGKYLLAVTEDEIFLIHISSGQSTSIFKYDEVKSNSDVYDLPLVLWLEDGRSFEVTLKNKDWLENKKVSRWEIGLDGTSKLIWEGVGSERG